MYNDPKLIKGNIFKGLLDDYEMEIAEEVINLLKMQKGTFVRTAILNEVSRFHARNSIGKDAAQQDFLNERLRA